MLTFPSPISKFASGTATPTGSVTTTFMIPHGLGSIPNFAMVMPKNALATALYSLTWDATNITVTYLAALTGSLSLAWFAVV